MFSRKLFFRCFITFWMCWPSTVVRAIPFPGFTSPSPLPYLRQQGTATQLIVDQEPFLMLAGELGNSSASSLAYMNPIWPKLAQMNLNTVLVPVYWDLIEPKEGAFNFTLVDGLIEEARRHDLRLVLLWFGSWKNSMSCYVPAWIKTDPQRFPRVRLRNGQAMEMLTVFSDASRQADTHAFAALMRHLRDIDNKQHTVIMVQVENEVGMLQDARDWSSPANEAFARPVPRKLMNYLSEHKDTLALALSDQWKVNDFKRNGTWETVFGKGLATDEIFMAWHYAEYVNEVAAAGKAEYPLPMFVNAALIRPNYKPGQYPSAGPLPHLMDIWRAGAPAIDFLSPDIYFPNFTEWCRLYHQPRNPLFIPEAALEPDAAVHALYAIGAHDAMGFSPFSIESQEYPSDSPIAKSYRLLLELSPLILEQQGKGTMAGILLDKEHPTQEIVLGNYRLTVSHDYTWGRSGGDAEAATWPRTGGLIISTGPDTYVMAGNGIIVTFAPKPPDEGHVGILSIREMLHPHCVGHSLSSKKSGWIPGRWMNGDQSHQGRHLRLPLGTFGIQSVSLYHYQ